MVAYTLKAGGPRGARQRPPDLHGDAGRGAGGQPGRAAQRRRTSIALCSPNRDGRDFIATTFAGLYFPDADHAFLDAAWSHVDEFEGAKRALALSALCLAAAWKQPRGVFTVTTPRYDDGRRQLHTSLELLFREAVERCNAAVMPGPRRATLRRRLRGRPGRARRSSTSIRRTRPPRDDTCYVKRYHFLEGLATYWRGQEIMWETRTRKLRKRHTPFGSKRTVRVALDRLFDHFGAPQTLVVSYGSNADLDAAELEALLARHRRYGAPDRDPALATRSGLTAPPHGGSRPSTCSSPPDRAYTPLVQEMVIYGVSFDMVGKQPIVLLKAVDTNKFLPIWIGHPEAAAILMKLQGASTPRPMTHDLLFDMLGELEVACTRVSVTELRENTFYASITLSVNGREVEIDSRPSDALALAVRSGAPIFAAEDVIAESAIEFEHEVEDTEEVVDKFKEFLDRVTPEDFAGGDD